MNEIRPLRRWPKLRATRLAAWCAVAGVVLALPHAALTQASGALTLSQVPLFLGSTVRPNVLVIYDNSQSMDADMPGRVINGDDPTTRGNVARDVLRSTITNYRSAFNWGLESFATAGAGLYTTYAYYFGDASGVTITGDCPGGVSPSNGGRRCVPNPEPAGGPGYITYDRSGDDRDINDVLYTSDWGPQLYGIGISGSTSYYVYRNRAGAPGSSSWTPSDFSGSLGTMSFTPTDAGFLPATPPYSRLFWLRRGWGYNANISGAGRINQPVAVDSASQYSALMALLAPESRWTSSEIKNSAVFTPLAGSFDTARSYFAGTLGGTSSPITDSCQRNFVMLATDGNPTGRTDGSMYPMSEQTTVDATGTPTFRSAANDVFSRITALRSTPYGGTRRDIQTYVIGLGDSVQNPASIANLDRMASLGGTTQAYLASDRVAFDAAIQRVVQDIQTRVAGAAPVSLNSGSLRTGASLYQGRFSSADWSGQLLSVALAADGSPASSPTWDAGRVLNTQDWNTGRRILTYRADQPLGARGVALRWPATPSAPTPSEISPALVTALNTNPTTGSADGYGLKRLEFLRGSTERETRFCTGCSAPVFRSRATSVLGDIVGGAPAWVGGAASSWRDTIDPAPYSVFSAAVASRTPVVYVGANDGMLHAIRATDGAEMFAYVPNAVRDSLSKLTANPYAHLYTVDGPPTVGDAVIGGAWRTLLVAGLGAGAQGLYALDVTDPTLFANAETPANARSIVRWETAPDSDVGNIIGRPILAKTRDGRWRAIIGNGVNPANNRAVLLLVDLEDGSVVKVSTGDGSASAPNGLSAATTVSTNNSGVVDYAFAGDLRGNLWKFDLSSANPSDWKVAHTSSSGAPVPLFTTPRAADGSVQQSITSRLDVARDPSGQWFVVFGTGRYLAVGDNAAGATQALYGIRDGAAPVAMSQLAKQIFVPGTVNGADGRSYRLSSNVVGTPSDGILTTVDATVPLADYRGSSWRGWRLELPDAGERVISEITLRNGRAIVSSLVPAPGCDGGGSGWIIDIDSLTGNRADALDTNGDGKITPDDRIVTSGLPAKRVSAVRVDAMPSAVTIIRNPAVNPDGTRIEDKLANTTSGSVVRVRESGGSAKSRRASWEQLQ